MSFPEISIFWDGGGECRLRMIVSNKWMKKNEKKSVFMAIIGLMNLKGSLVRFRTWSLTSEVLTYSTPSIKGTRRTLGERKNQIYANRAVIDELGEATAAWIQYTHTAKLNL